MPETRRWLPAAGLAGALVVVALVLVQPNHPQAMTAGALRVFPLELPVLAILLLLVQGWPGRALRVVLVAILVLMACIKAADLAGHLAFARRVNPMLDLHLVPASWRMLSGAVGVPGALLGAVAVIIVPALLAAVLWWATGRIARITHGTKVRRGLALALVPFGLIALADAAHEISPVDPPGAAFTGRLAYDHARDIRRARDDLARFRDLARRDQYATLPPEQLLAGLRGTDVLVIFVESYGRAAHDNSNYSATTRDTLEEITGQLAGKGLAMRSAWVTAPMVGGQSWLAHASVLSGLSIENQGRYAALLASPRRTLLHLAQAAGWRSVAVMPAITLAWPEAGYFGYDRVLAAADLGYRGQPFNWVTMPDQFTLAAFERAELGPGPRPPVFAEIALISSHAPWTPIPPLLSWDALGDGRVFDRFATAGDAPDVVWRDSKRIRDQFGRAIDYSLRVVGAFAARRAETAPLIIVLGDHQPVSLVSEGVGGRDVPVHIIGPPGIVARLDPWGWTPGLLPRPSAPVWGMHELRDRFLDVFAGARHGADPGSIGIPAIR